MMTFHTESDRVFYMSGRLDDATQHLMSLPRCGHPDIQRGMSGGVGGLPGVGFPRTKRYAAGKPC